MTSPAFVTFTNALLSGVASGAGTIRVSTQAPIKGLYPVTPGTLGTDSTLSSVTMIAYVGGTPDFVSGSVATVASSLSGIAPVGPTILSNIELGAVAFGSLGTDAVSVSGTQYFAEFLVSLDRTVTNLTCLNGTIVGPDKAIYFICDNAGTVLGTTSLAGVTCATTDSFQSIALLTPLAISAGRYWTGFQVNGATTKHRTIAASTYQRCTGSLVGVFGTIANITPTTTITAGVGPIMQMT